MLRVLAITMIMVLSISVLLPFTNEAHGIRQTVEIGQQRHHRHHSRAWWRRYHARQRQKRLAAEMAHRNASLSLPQNISVSDLSVVSAPSLPSLPSNATSAESLPPPVMMAASEAPAPVVSNTATRPRVVNTAHPAFKPEAATAKLPGTMNLAVVALSRPNPAFLTSREEKKMLGGVAVADLRRMVIDKMVSSGGWVVNDFVREINGARVFVVTARTPKDALTPEKAWTFYFTEAGGRIYGLTTDSPVEFADRMTNEAERFIESLRAKASN